ncbi:phosphoglucosamine mutase [Isosphaeraceae bacterium EP7]
MAGTRIASVSGLRGIVGDGLDPIVVVEFAAAYASGLGPGPVIVGHDGRVSAHVFEAAVVSAIAATGHDVLRAGPVATPTIGRLVRERRAAGGVQISASHNPPTYNGMKMFQPGGMVLDAGQGRELLDRLERRDFRWASWDKLGQIEGLERPEDDHLEAVLRLVDVASIRSKGFVVALDACHGAGGRLGTRLLRELGCRPIVLGGEPDGKYDHPPEPTATNLAAFARIVEAAGASIGFALDPDSDRLAIVDERGRYIGEELTLALAAMRRFSQVQGPFVLNLSTSRTAEDVAKARGCQVHRTPVGEIHVVQGIKANDAVLGGEGNGGVIDPRVGFVRDPFVGIALVLDLLASEDKSLSEWVDVLPQYAMVKDQYPRGQIEAAELFDQIAQTYPEARADRRDGLRLDWPDAWAHVRVSNTEPIVRVITETADQTSARSLADAIGRAVTTGRKA